MVAAAQKRPFEDISQEAEEEHGKKRFRHAPVTLPTPPSEASSPSLAGLEIDSVDVSRMPEAAPRQLLSRSIVLALNHVGFSGAQREALESFADTVESYMDRLLREATSSMLAARRRLPVVHDFEYALDRFHVPRLSIEPHLKPPVGLLASKYELEDPLEVHLNLRDSERLLGGALSGQSDKATRLFIPRSFSSFPSRHTYRFTEVKTSHKRDMRKVREEAAVVARQGEEALRKIMKVGKSVEEKNMTRTANKSLRSKKRHDLWEIAMQELQREMPTGKLLKEDDHCMMVNSERQYWRRSMVKGAMVSRNISRVE